MKRSNLFVRLPFLDASSLKSNLLILLIVAILPLSGCTKLKLGWMRYTADTTPEVRKFDAHKRHQWKPEGKRQIQVTNNVTGPRTYWKFRHSDAMNTDEVIAITSPAFELDWEIEPNYWIGGSVMLDKKGDIYATPVYAPDKSILTKIDGKTGQVLWKIKSKKFSMDGGIPTILEDPEHPGNEIIYLATSENVLAVKPSGAIIYRTPKAFPDPPKKASFDNLADYSNYGPNYNPVMDALVYCTGRGMIWGVDRKTGKQVIEPFTLPGKKSPGVEKRKIPPKLKALETGELSFLFKEAPEGFNIGHIVARVLGEHLQMSNYFSIDQKTGAMWFTGTDLDENDGKKDGISEDGALFRIDPVRTPDGKYPWKVKMAAKATFKGGSAATPGVSGDGKRVYVGDAEGNLIAVDYDGKVVWKFSLGKKLTDMIVGSIAVSSDNGELYAVTRREVIQVLDKGDHAVLGWRSQLDMYKDIDSAFIQSNIMTATITANGIAFTGGVGPQLKIFGDAPVFLPVRVGVGLLDRKTGKLRWFADGKDLGQDSVAMMAPTPDGGLIVPHSPVRRAFTRILFGDRTHPARGGMTKYGPRRIDLMLREIASASSDRIRRAIEIFEIQPEGTIEDLSEVKALIQQAKMIAPRGIKRGDITAALWQETESALNEVITLHISWSSSHNMAELKKSATIMADTADRLDVKK